MPDDDDTRVSAYDTPMGVAFATPVQQRVRRARPGLTAIAALCLALALLYVANAVWNVAHLLQGASFALADWRRALAAVTLPFPVVHAAAPLWLEALSGLGFILVCAAGIWVLRAGRGVPRAETAAPTAAQLDPIDPPSPAAPPDGEMPQPARLPVAEPDPEPPSAAEPAAAELPMAAAPAATLTPTLESAPASPPPPVKAAPEAAAAKARPDAASPVPRVFISHTSADNDFGYPLVDRLRAELGGVDAVFYDSRGHTPDGIGWEGGVRPAGYFELDVFRELRERPVFVVLLSEQSLASPWVQDEILLAWKQKNERGRTVPKVIVPVIVPAAGDLLPPEPLDLIQTVSFVERPEWGYAQAFAALLVAIRSRQTQLRVGEVEPPFDLEELLLPEHFFGRGDDLAWVLERLRPGATAGITALRGLGGIGKTALAAEVVQRVFEEGRFPSGIVVQRCDGLHDPADVLKRVLASFDPERRQPETSDLKALAEVARKVLRGRRILVVLDNVEPELDIAAVLQRLSPTGAAILLTAREQLPLALGETRRLDLLSDAAALDLFAEWYGRGNAAGLRPEERPLAERIVRALGNHTLAVKLAGAQAADLARPLAAFADEVTAQPLNIQDQGANATLALKETFMRSVKALPASGELGDVRRLFAALAAFATPDFGRRAAMAIGEALDLPNPGHAVDLLLRRAMLDNSTDETLPEGADRERLRLHPLLRELAAELLDEATRAAASLAIAVFYADHANATSDPALLPDAENIAGALEWAHDYAPDADRDALVARICDGMRRFWRDRSRTRDSLRYLPWGVEAAERIAASGERDDQLTLARLQLAYAEALITAGKLRDAEDYINRSLSIRRSVGDARGEGVALGKLGDILVRRGDLAGAQHNYERYLAIMGEVGDAREEGVALSNLGDILVRRGDLAGAQHNYERYLAIMGEVGDARGEGVALGNLGDILVRRGDLAGAQHNYERYLAIMGEVGDTRGEGVALSKLGDILVQRGDLAGAQHNYERVLAIMGEVGDTRGEGVALSKLGHVAWYRGDLTEAGRLYLQSLEIDRIVGNRQDEGVNLAQLGRIARDTRRPDEAEQYFRQCLALSHEIEDAINEARISVILGEFLIQNERGEPDEGCRMLRQAIAIYHEMGVPDEEYARELAAELGCDVPE